MSGYLTIIPGMVQKWNKIDGPIKNNCHIKSGNVSGNIIWSTLQ